MMDQHTIQLSEINVQIFYITYKLLNPINVNIPVYFLTKAQH